jgi:ubiquinone/menaquinone biosynthesis C-methylase UbiE
MISSPEKNVLEFGFIPGQKVADMGSGAGHYTLPLSKALGNVGSVYAVDKNESSLIRLLNLVQSESRYNVDIILGDIEKTQGTYIANDFLDGVVFTNIIIHLEERKAAMEEAMRILKPGGRLCLIDWSDTTPLNISRDKTKHNLLTQKKVAELLESVGFVASKEFDAGEHHFGLIYLKPAIHKEIA